MITVQACQLALADSPLCKASVHWAFEKRTSHNKQPQDKEYLEEGEVELTLSVDANAKDVESQERRADDGNIDG